MRWAPRAIRECGARLVREYLESRERSLESSLRYEQADSDDPADKALEDEHRAASRSYEHAHDALTTFVLALHDRPAINLGHEYDPWAYAAIIDGHVVTVHNINTWLGDEPELDVAVVPLGQIPNLGTDTAVSHPRHNGATTL